MHICLSGTNWTGKTTTALALEKRLSPRELDIISLSELIIDCPHPILENQTIDASRWLINEFNKKCIGNDNSSIRLFDRGPLDIMAYMLYSESRNKSLQPDTFIDIVNSSLAHISIIYYLPTFQGWPLKITNPRISVDFARSIESYMLKAISILEVNIFELPCDIDKRVEIITAYISENSPNSLQ